MPEALLNALAADQAAGAVFQRLSYSHRREYTGWSAEAKKDETRARRIAVALGMLRAGETLK